MQYGIYMQTILHLSLIKSLFFCSYNVVSFWFLWHYIIHSPKYRKTVIWYKVQVKKHIHTFLTLNITWSKASHSAQSAMQSTLKYLRTSSACHAASSSSSHALVFSCQVSKSPNSDYNETKNRTRIVKDHPFSIQQSEEY